MKLKMKDRAVKRGLDYNDPTLHIQCIHVQMTNILKIQLLSETLANYVVHFAEKIRHLKKV